MVVECEYTPLGLKDDDDNTTECRRLSSGDYVDIVWTTCAEFPGDILGDMYTFNKSNVSGILWVIILLIVLGRKKSIAITTFLAACCFNLLFICTSK